MPEEVPFAAQDWGICADNGEVLDQGPLDAGLAGLRDGLT